MKVKELLGLLRFTHNIEVRQDNDFVGYTDSNSVALQSIYEREISNWFVHDGLGGKIDIVIDLKDTEAADQEESPAAADETRTVEDLIDEAAERFKKVREKYITRAANKKIIQERRALEREKKVLKQTVETLKYLLSYFNQSARPRCSYKNIRAALAIAISAVETQTPKEVVENKRCPKCGRLVAFIHCERCGQRIEY